MYYFHKKLKIKKKTSETPKKTFLVGFFMWFFWVFWSGFLLPTLPPGVIVVRCGATAAATGAATGGTRRAAVAIATTADRPTRAAIGTTIAEVGGMRIGGEAAETREITTSEKKVSGSGTTRAWMTGGGREGAVREGGTSMMTGGGAGRRTMTGGGALGRLRPHPPPPPHPPSPLYQPHVESISLHQHRRNNTTYSRHFFYITENKHVQKKYC